MRRQQHVGGRHLVAAHRYLASTYGEMGREKEARTHLAEVLRLQPNFSLESARRFISRASFHKDPAYVERYLDGLRKAGLK